MTVVDLAGWRGLSKNSALPAAFVITQCSRFGRGSVPLVPVARRDDAQWQRLDRRECWLRAESVELKQTISRLEEKIEDLEERLGRNPRNSSMPPSAEGLAKPPAPNRAERRKAKRRPGKQPGSEGHHLARVEHPDEVVVHAPSVCGHCGEDLAGAEIVDVEARQVFELPAVKAHVTEHQMVRVRCRCGCETKAPSPPEATAPACYGPGIRALAVYLSVYQHLPYERLGEIFADVLGVGVSVGVITAMVAEAGGALGLFLDVVTDSSRCTGRALRRDRGARRGVAALGARGLERPLHLAVLSPAPRQRGHGRHRGDRQDGRRRDPRRLEALPCL